MHYEIRLVALTAILTIAFSFPSAIAQLPDLAQVPAKDEHESWEITKRYGEAWLRDWFLNHEALPEKIAVPAVEVAVVDSDGKPVAGADVVSHTPRHWVRVQSNMTIHPQPHGSVTKTNAEGRFTLPARTEPYRVLVLHDAGAADVTHEDLLNAKGQMTLERWSKIEGTAVLDGKPLANTQLLVRPDYSGWSYSIGGPRVTGDIQVMTDGQGAFTIDKVPALDGTLYLLRSLTDANRQKKATPLSHAMRYVCRPGELTRLELGIGKSVKGRLNLRSIEPEQPIDWADAVVWLRHGDSDSQPAIELPPEIAELDETARRDWERDWQVTTPEGRAFAAKQHFQMNQNFYAAVSDDGRFQIDGVPEGTYDLAVRGARVRDSEQPLPTYFSTTQIQVSHPHDKPVTVDHCDMVDYETWHDHLTQTHTTEEKSTSKFAIHRVIGHRSARPFGRGGEKMEPRPIRFGTMSPQDTRFDAMRPEKYPLDGIEYNPTPLISLDDITAYDWRAHKIYLKDGARDRLLRNIQPNVWGVPFVIVVDGSPAYLGAFWTTVSSYLANMPTICLDKWVLNSPEADGPHPPQDVLRIENSQVLSEGEEPSDRRDNVPLREALEEAGLLINAWSKTEPAE